MPVRSLNSSVLKWPDRQTVDAAVRQWAADAAARRCDVALIAYFGSYARGDWGAGSDADILVVLKDTPIPFERRGAEWDASALPVPAEVLVYTEDEWERMKAETGFGRKAAAEMVEVFRNT